MHSIWEDIKGQISAEVPKNSFSLWINPLAFMAKTDKTITLSCPNKFSRDWVTENYAELIQGKFKQVLSKDMDVVFKTGPYQRVTLPSPQPQNTPQMLFPNVPSNGIHHRLSLNRNFTFERFIVGRSNEFAYSASNALAHDDGCKFATLLMLANTGLGKTHLSQAVGHAVLEHNPNSRVFYMTAEGFTNEMISALKRNCIEEFKNKYRKRCDVLLLDEVHFLSGKRKTQDELEYTLDALANSNKKIIFTSSLLPKDIPNMSKPLRSRLTSGLVTEIEDPDYETRIKILTRKAKEYNMALSDEIVQFLASRLTKDIRQMESALKCLKAKSDLLKEKLNLDLAKDVVTCLVSEERAITFDDIKDLVCKYYRVEPDNIRSKSRKKEFAYPRNIFIYLCRRYTENTLETIARTINRSHSTVLYAAELVDHKMKTDAKLKRQVHFLSQKLEEMKQ